MSFAARVMEVVEHRPGIADRPLAEALACSVQQVNGECRHLENLGLLSRKKGDGEPIGNYPVRQRPTLTVV